MIQSSKQAYALIFHHNGTQLNALAKSLDSHTLLAFPRDTPHFLIVQAVPRTLPFPQRTVARPAGVRKYSFNSENCSFMAFAQESGHQSYHSKAKSDDHFAPYAESG
jgi:hypothetical protein